MGTADQNVKTFELELATAFMQFFSDCFMVILLLDFDFIQDLFFNSKR